MLYGDEPHNVSYLCPMDVEVEVQVDQSPDELIRYFAYGDDVQKCWYITQQKDARFIGCFALLELGCKITDRDLTYPEEMPKKGDVVCDVDGNHVLVVTTEWI